MVSEPYQSLKRFCFQNLLSSCSKWYNLSLFLFWSFVFRRRERTSHSWLPLHLPLLLLFLYPNLTLLILPIRSKTLLNIPTSLNLPKLVSPSTLLSALISCTNGLAPLPAVYVPDALTLKNISNLHAWISVLFKPPLLSNMSLWRFPPSCFPTWNKKVILIFILEASD